MTEPTISLRDWFAAHALKGLLSAPTLRWCSQCGQSEELGQHNALERFYSIPDICRQSFEISDAMMESRDKGTQVRGLGYTFHPIPQPPKHEDNPSALPGRTRGDQQPPTTEPPVPKSPAPLAKSLDDRKSEDSPQYSNRPAAPITRRADCHILDLSVLTDLRK